MKKYIDFNTKKRKNATNDFEKKNFKFMINSVYGKTMENLRKSINVRLVNNAEDFLKYTSTGVDPGLILGCCKILQKKLKIKMI